MTTVGPFAVIGTKVVETCALTGTHYCDITGETEWVRENVLLLSAAAEKTGAKIVSLCGMDSIPFDLSTVMLSKNMPKGEALEEVTISDDIMSAPSGGTIATMIQALEGKTVRDMTGGAGEFGGDPMTFTSAGDPPSEYKAEPILPANPFFPMQSPFSKCSKLGFFVMSAVNGDAVKRSVAVNEIGAGKKGKAVVYREGLNMPDWKSSVTITLMTYLSLAVVAAKPIRYGASVGTVRFLDFLSLFLLLFLRA